MDGRTREVCAWLRSERASERQKGCKALKDILESSALNDFSSHFDSLFNAVHDFVLVECEKKENLKTISNVELQCSSILFSLLPSANKCGKYINCTKLLDSCLEIFKCKKFLRIIGNAYVTLLNKYVICVDHYAEQLTPHQWADLFEAVVELCSQNISESLKTTQLLLLVLKEGLSRCHLILPVRDNLMEISNLFIKKNNEKKDHLQECLLEIVILIIKNVGSESRLTVCKFTETIVPYLLKFYDQTSVGFKHKKKLLFKSLKYCLQIHHPKGYIGNKPGCLAHDWNIWNDHLVSIYQLVFAECEFVNQNFNNIRSCGIQLNENNLYEEFIDLAVLIFHQNLHNKLNVESLNKTADGHSSKRCKLDVIDFQSIDQLINFIPVNFYPWILIIKQYLIKFGHTISCHDYKNILNMLYSMCSSDNMESSHNVLYECIQTVFKQIKEWDTMYSEIMLNMWNIILRKASVQSAISDSCHKIIHDMLSIKFFHLNLESLIKLYCDKTMPYCDCSLLTLNILLENYNSKIVCNNVRSQIIDWLFSNYMLYNSHTVISVLFKLSVKENSTFSKHDFNPEGTDFFNKIFKDQEQFILISDFEGKLFVSNDKEESIGASRNSFALCESSYNLIIDTLLRNISKCIEINKERNIVQCELLINVNICLKLMFAFIDENILKSLDEVKAMKIQIISALDFINHTLPQYFLKIDDTKKLELLKHFNTLLQSENCNRDVLIFLRERIHKEIIQLLCDLIMEDVDETDDNKFSLMELCSDQPSINENPLKNIAIENLLNYNIIKSIFTFETFPLLLQVELYDIKTESDFNKAINIVCNIANIKDEISINAATQFLQEICKKVFRDNNKSYIILETFHNLLQSISLYGNNTTKENCIIMLKSYLKRCSAFYYSPRTLGQALKCVFWIINVDKNDWGKSIYENLFTNLFSSLHSIRLYSSYCLSFIIAKNQPADFEKVIRSISDVFKVDVSDSIPSIKQDEGANRSSSILHLLASISVMSPIWDKQSLATIMNIYNKHNIDINLLKKVIILIANESGISTMDKFLDQNIAFLINYWFESKNSIDKFPWALLNIDSFQEFCIRYRKIILAYEWYWLNDNSDRKALALLVKEYEASKLFSECLPILLVARLSQGSICNKSLKALLENYFPHPDFIDEISLKRILKTEIYYVLYELVNLTSDENDILEIFEWTGHIPYTSKPFLTKEQFNNAIKYLNESFDSDIMIYLCDREPSVIQKLLLEIWSNIENQNCLERKILSLYQYWIFFQTLPLDTTLNEFICHFIINSLIFMIEKYKNIKKFKTLNAMTCKILYCFLKSICSKLYIIASLVPGIFNMMIENIVENKLNKKSYQYKLITLLISVQGKFEKKIIKFDPLPNEEIFLELKNCNKKYLLSTNDMLNDYIEIFLSRNFNGRNEGLRVLYEKLISDHDDLLSMFNNLKKLKNISEECKSSNLHKLMCNLFDITLYSTDEKCRTYASKCIGKIGSADFQTLVLKLPPDHKNTINKPLDCFIYVTFDEIKELVFNSDPHIIRAASKAMKSLMSFKIGENVLENISIEKNCTFSRNLLIPFSCASKAIVTFEIKIMTPLFDIYFDRGEIWYNFSYKKHSDWIVDIVISCLKCFNDVQSFFFNIIEIFQLRSDIAEKCFYPLIGLMLSHSNENQVSTICTHINNFFNHFYNTTFFANKKISKKFDQRSVECMLKLIQFIMLQLPYYDWNKNYSDHREKNNFELNYLPIAWAAYCSGSYFMAILCCDTWCCEKNDNVPTLNFETIDNISQGPEMLTIMRMCYESLNDGDALSGCGSSHLSNPVHRRNQYIFNGAYADALLMHDISLSQFTPDETKDSQNLAVASFVRSLHTSGFYHLTEKYMQSFSSDIAFDDIKYDCYLKLGDWSLEVDSVALASNEKSLKTDFDNSWSAHQYLCLKVALKKNLEYVDENFLEICNNARRFIWYTYQYNTLESCQSVCELATKFQCLQEIEYFVSNISNEKVLKNPFSNLISMWSVERLLPFNYFKNIEPLISQRIVVLEHISKKYISSEMNTSIGKLILEYAELALSQGLLHISSRWISCALSIVDSYENKSDFTNLVRLVEGKVAWKSEHYEVAMHLLKSVISNADNINKELHAKAILQYGTWMMETRRENAQDILNKYFKESLKILNSEENSPTKLNAYFAIARFADCEYKQIDNYIKSSTFSNKVKFMEQCQETYNALKRKQTQNQNSITKDEFKAMVFNEKQKTIDQNEIFNIKEERDMYLQLAMKYYLQTLLTGNENDLSVFRVISLWLDNRDLNFNEDSNKSLKYFLTSIPSSKFILIIPQLAPRMDSNEKNSFQENVHELITKCAMEHPHHVLPILFALKYSYKDMEYKNNVEQCDTSKDTYIASANNIIQLILSKKNKSLMNIINEMDKLNQSMIKLANLKIKDKSVRGASHPIPRAESLRSLKQLNNILVPTIALPIKKDGNYNNIPSIHSFSDSFLLVGGVNAPKKISCKGSDGINRYMLIKGEDDIRQDAVMQQVFEIVNNLLANSLHFKQRHLVIRTYKIVVLSRRSGIIEWCNGTEPLGNLLIGADYKSGYHVKYRPKDLPPKTAREMMMKKHKNNEEKLATFKTILSNLKPVFHIFFLENFRIPAVWYERRLAYTHSVAASSMIGYILGLGDRHVQNILIDQSTAEVIHIDFGITFEQGKLQPTPETVPFRLTQDMVAGLGCSGIEGVFRKSCEKTMDVLKSNQETLITILEVLLCDPLYIWTVSQEQAYKKQNILIPDVETPLMSKSNESSVTEAERALLKVKSKLEGIEFGSILATSGQVARLLQQATDITNLSRLFSGWQPYL